MKRILIYFLVFIAFGKLKAQEASFPYPIIFVHGINSNDNTWGTLVNSLVGVGADKTIPVYDISLNADGNNSKAIYDQDVKPVESNGGWRPNREPVPSKSHVYLLNFDNSKFESSIYSGSTYNLSNEAAIYKQGYALKLMINEVLFQEAKNGYDKVMLVGHSMGGLAIREYLQRTENGVHKWWVDSDPVIGHKVAKAITIGTPHRGSNMGTLGTIIESRGLNLLVSWFKDINLFSEAVRDLAWNYGVSIPWVGESGVPGMYLCGGMENSAPTHYFYNTDVNCDGDELDNINRLNKANDGTMENQLMLLPRNIKYCWVVSNILDLNSDGIVNLDRQWLYSEGNPEPNNLADTVLIHKFHTEETNDINGITRGLDEPNSKELAYKIECNNPNQSVLKKYKGYTTYGSNMTELDSDWFKFTSTVKGDATLTVANIPDPNYWELRIENADGSISNSKNQNDDTPSVTMHVENGTEYYVKILSKANSQNWMNPYTFSIQLQETITPTLTLGKVSGNLHTGDTELFSVIYTDKKNLSPSEVRVYIDSNSYLMTKNIADNDFTDGVEYTYSTTFNSTKTYAYKFGANSNDGTALKTFPENGNLAFTIMQSAVGWEASIDPLNTNYSPATVKQGTTLTVNNAVKNTGLYDYTDINGVVEMRYSNGNLIKSAQFSTGTIAKSTTRIVPPITMTVPVDALNGSYTVTSIIYPTLDQDPANNSYSNSFYIGENLGNEQFRNTVGQTIINSVSPKTMTITSPINSHTFTYAGINTSTGYSILKDDQSNTNSIYVNQIKIYSALDRLIQCDAVWSDGTGYAALTGYYAINNGAVYDNVQINASPGTTAYAFATAPSGYLFTSTNCELYSTSSTSIKSWLGSISKVNAWNRIKISFNIPSDAPLGKTTLYLLTLYSSPANVSDMTRLTFNITNPVPTITTLSKTNVSADDNIVISGSNLGISGTVKFGELQATTSNWTSTSITCRVPAWVVNGVVTVINTNGASNGLAYTVISSTGDPTVAQSIPDQSMNQNSSLDAATLGSVFADPNNDPLVYTATSSSPNVTTSIVNGILTLKTDAIASGSVQITVTAKDLDNVTVQDIFNVNVIAPPQIQVISAMTDFGNIESGANSLPQSYTVSGSNLTDYISIVSPTGFQISTNSSSGYSSSVTLTQSGGTVASTPLYVRFSPTRLGVFTGNIAHSSMGAYIQNVMITGTGASLLPVLTTTIPSFTSTSAISGGNITSEGGAAITARGVCWSTSANPTVDLTTKTSDGTGTGVFTSNITGLTPGTTYHVRAYATNSSGTGYGNDQPFKTVSIPVANAGTDQSVNEGAIVTLDGSGSSEPDGKTLTYKWTGPAGITLSSTTIAKPTFTAPSVTANTEYRFTLMVNNGTVDSPTDEVVITVNNAITVPVLSTTTPTSVLTTSASSGGNITSDGGASITARGVCWSTSANPTIDLTTKTSDGTGTGVFTSNISGLSPGTTYHVRAYATNSAGTGYGNDQPFKTVSIPVANAGTDQPVNEGAIVTLDGSGSSEPDGKSLTYKWTGPAGITLSSTTIAKPTFTAPSVTANTEYRFTLMVNNGTVDSPSDEVVITVQKSNLNNGLIAYYPLNGNANDASGNNNNGTLIGGVIPTVDRNGNQNQALQFNGTNGYVQVPNSTSLQSPSTAITIAGWVWIDGFNGTAVAGIVNKTNTSAYGQYGLNYQEWSTPGLNFICEQTNISCSASTKLDLSKWYFVVATYENGTAKIYLDGVKISERASSGTIIKDNYPLTMGIDTPGSTEYLKGKLDDIRIYNRALTVEEIGSLYKQTPNTNQIPIANAGLNQSVNEGTTVTLDGSASSDPDGNTLTYKWTAPAGITLSSTTGAKPTFTAPNVTANIDYPFTLVVNDGTVDSQSDEVIITVNNLITVPVLTTTTPTSILATSASSGGNITSDGDAAITARGVCWSTSANPTVDLITKTSDGTGAGIFTSNITGLTAGTTYHVRAYATNSAGTGYGNDVTLIPPPNNTVSDIDGNIYLTVTIGTQVWMGSNLKTTKYSDGTTIPLVTDNAAWRNLTTPGYCWYNNSISNKDTYGALYNWYTVNTAKLCPTGWHVPSDTEWTVLTDFLGGESVAGGKMKEMGTSHWVSPNPATNESGFNALPAGYRYYDNGVFYWFSQGTGWLSSTENSATNAWARRLNYDIISIEKNNTFKTGGMSVRCLKDAIVAIPTLGSTTINNITPTTASSGGNITSDGGAAISARGVCWSTSANPTVELTTKTSDGAGAGIFTSNITGLTAGMTYHVRAYATNSAGTAYGEDLTFTTPYPDISVQDEEVLNNIMSGLKIVERIKSGTMNLTIDQTKMLTNNYNSCVKTGDFIVYTKTAQSLDPTDWTAESGTGFTGDRLQTNLRIKFAWKTDGTVYMGAMGTDDEVLATIVDGTERSYGCYSGLRTFFEGYALATELKNMQAASVVSGITALSDLGTADFFNNMTNKIFNRFSKPIYRIFSAVAMQGSPYSTLNPEFAVWCPFAGLATGTAKRSFTLSYTNNLNSYVNAVANNDNSNSSYVKLDGALAAQMSKWNENYYRRTAIYPLAVELGATTIWAHGAPRFTMAVVCDNVTATNLSQTPTGGLSNNRAPIIVSIPVYGNVIIPVTPTLVTTIVSDAKTTTASSGGNITSDGGASITSRGVCWSTSVNPTISLATKTSDGTGTGTFTSSITGLTPGTSYHVRAYATNSAGTGYGEDKIFSTPPASPIANAGADQSVTEGILVTLDGAGSSDPGGKTLTYKWTAPAGITLSSTSVAKPTFTAPTICQTTNYTFDLVVNNGNSDSATDQVVVKVNITNKIAVANAGPDQTVNEGTLVTLDGSGSTDSDGDVLAYLWTAPAGFTLSSTTVAKPTFTAPEVSANTNYNFSLVVTNHCGINSSSDLVTIIVKNNSTVSHFIPVWTGNGVDHMNINLYSAKLDGVELEAGDEVGIFDGTLCVGVGKLSAPISSQSTLDIAVSKIDGTGNGYTPGNAITYKLFDSSKNLELANVTATYANDNPVWSTDGKFAVGATAIVALSGVTKVSQNIAMNTGWNIISTYVTPSNLDLKAIFQSLIDAGSFKKVMDEAGKTLENFGAFGGWKNNIGNLNAAKGYKINLTSAGTLTIEGTPVSLPLNYTLAVGWNIISYPSATVQDAKALIQPLIEANQLVKVMDEAGKTIENFGAFGGWKNNIGNFLPGKGYKVNVATACTLTITGSANKAAVIVPDVLASAHFAKVYTGNGTDHFNVHLVDLASSGLVAGDQIGIFDGNYCVGAATIGHDQLMGGNISIPSSFNDELTGKVNGFTVGHAVTLQLYRDNQAYPLTPSIVSGSQAFEKNGSLFVKVTASDLPVAKISVEADQVRCFPNPFVDQLTIEIRLTQPKNLEVKIYDLSGKLVRSLFKGEAGTSETLIWDGTNGQGTKMGSGTYILKVNEMIEKVALKK